MMACVERVAVAFACHKLCAATVLWRLGSNATILHGAATCETAHLLQARFAVVENAVIHRADLKVAALPAVAVPVSALGQARV